MRDDRRRVVSDLGDSHVRLYGHRGLDGALKTHRSKYPSILAEHHRILREAFTEYGGREIDNQGDSFFIALPRARDAMLAAAHDSTPRPGR